MPERCEDCCHKSNGIREGFCTSGGWNKRRAQICKCKTPTLVTASTIKGTRARGFERRYTNTQRKLQGY